MEQCSRVVTQHSLVDKYKNLDIFFDIILTKIRLNIAPIIVDSTI